jgi:hypothetical protein
MSPLSQEDSTPTPTVVVVVRNPLLNFELPGNDGGVRQQGIDRRRTASYSLSYISEHQKENSRNHEDAGLGSSAQAAKTPLLEPTRRSHSRRGLNGMSRSSGGGSSISPMQLDAEQIETYWKQGINQQVVSTWLYTVPAGSKEQPGKHHPLVARSDPPGFSEVEWQSIQSTDARPSKVYIKSHKSTLSVGFDGPLSSISGASPHRSPSDEPNALLESSTFANCLACQSRKPNPDTSASIDWVKSRPKRKPRRIHNVSKSSDVDPSTRTYPMDSFSGETETPNSGERDSMDTLRFEELEDPQFSSLHTIQENALKSCPDFTHPPPPPSVSPAISRNSVGFLNPACYQLFI